MLNQLDAGRDTAIGTMEGAFGTVHARMVDAKENAERNVMDGVEKLRGK